GGAGDDLVYGGLGSDYLSGGPGKDRLSYGDHENAVTLTSSDGIDNDGQAGERDHIINDFEVFEGGDGNDSIVGTPRDDTIYGFRGNDTLIGGGGNDLIGGYLGNDSLE